MWRTVFCTGKGKERKKGGGVRAGRRERRRGEVTRGKGGRELRNWRGYRAERVYGTEERVLTLGGERAKGKGQRVREVQVLCISHVLLSVRSSVWCHTA